MQKIQRLLKSRVTQNAGWLIGGSIVNKLIAFIVGVWTARYLGPNNYGLINYAAAYTIFFFSLGTLGINSILVKQFIDDPEREGTTLGTTLVLQCISSVMSIVMIMMIVFVVDYGETVTIAVVFLCSLGLFFQELDTIKYWFQAKLQSKYAAIATTVAYVVSSAYKILLLMTDQNVKWFALATSVDYICVAVILFVAYKKIVVHALRFSLDKARELVGKSYHFILSGLMISIYGATDKLMLKQMLDGSAVAYYGTAVSIANVWVFVLAAIIDSLNPIIMETYRRNRQGFERKNTQLYAIVFYCSVVVSLLITIFARFGINLLYGEAYLPAVVPLRIVTWYVAFSYLGVARNAWVVCENCQGYLKYLYVGAAVVNVLLNALLIPAWGASGAALASLFTQISTIFVFPAFLKEMRPNVKMMADAISLREYKVNEGNGMSTDLNIRMSQERELELLKKRELDLLEVFIQTCNELKLKYYLLGGTLLGAVRHQGFIPWDDDIDVGMMRADYEIWVRESQKLMSEHYFVQTYKTDPEFPANFAKLRNSKTTFIETSVKKQKINHGIYIDVFPLDFYPVDSEAIKQVGRKKRYLAHKIGSCFTLAYEDTLHKVGRKLFGLLTPGSVYQAVEKRELLYTSIKQSSLIANLSGAWGEKEIVPAEWYGEGTDLIFEGLPVTAPKEYDKWLAQVYGDYMQLPPEEKRKPHHYTEVIDTERPYTEYV